MRLSSNEILTIEKTLIEFENKDYYYYKEPFFSEFQKKYPLIDFLFFALKLTKLYLQIFKPKSELLPKINKIIMFINALKQYQIYNNLTN